MVFQRELKYIPVKHLNTKQLKQMIDSSPHNPKNNMVPVTIRETFEDLVYDPDEVEKPTTHL